VSSTLVRRCGDTELALQLSILCTHRPLPQTADCQLASNVAFLNSFFDLFGEYFRAAESFTILMVISVIVFSDPFRPKILYWFAIL
jgi:hypothetical protein